jgi:hypothetical protein
MIVAIITLWVGTAIFLTVWNVFDLDFNDERSWSKREVKSLFATLLWPYSFFKWYRGLKDE